MCVKKWVYGDEREEIIDDAIIHMITEEEIHDTEDLNSETEEIISPCRKHGNVKCYPSLYWAGIRCFTTWRYALFLRN